MIRGQPWARPRHAELHVSNRPAETEARQSGIRSERRRLHHYSSASAFWKTICACPVGLRMPPGVA
jgi:hypothetical protein